MLIARDNQKKLFGTSMTACILGVPLCFGLSYLTMQYWNNAAIGAVVSDVLKEVLLIGLYLKILPKDIFDLNTKIVLSKCVLASIVTVSLLYGSMRLGLGLWMVFPCALIYAIMCYAFRCIRPDDFALVKSIFKRNSKS